MASLSCRYPSRRTGIFAGVRHEWPPRPPAAPVRPIPPSSSEEPRPHALAFTLRYGLVARVIKVTILKVAHWAQTMQRAEEGSAHRRIPPQLRLVIKLLKVINIDNKCGRLLYFLDRNDCVRCGHNEWLFLIIRRPHERHFTHRWVGSSRRHSRDKERASSGALRNARGSG